MSSPPPPSRSTTPIFFSSGHSRSNSVDDQFTDDGSRRFSVSSNDLSVPPEISGTPPSRSRSSSMGSLHSIDGDIERVGRGSSMSSLSDRALAYSCSSDADPRGYSVSTVPDEVAATKSAKAFERFKASAGFVLGKFKTALECFGNLAGRALAFIVRALLKPVEWIVKAAAHVTYGALVLSLAVFVVLPLALTARLVFWFYSRVKIGEVDPQTQALFSFQSMLMASITATETGAKVLSFPVFALGVGLEKCSDLLRHNDPVKSEEDQDDPADMSIKDKFVKFYDEVLEVVPGPKIEAFIFRGVDEYVSLILGEYDVDPSQASDKPDQSRLDADKPPVRPPPSQASASSAAQKSASASKAAKKSASARRPPELPISSEEFQEIISHYNIDRVRGDGDCLFTAIARQVGGYDPRDITAERQAMLEVRKKIVDFLEAEHKAGNPAVQDPGKDYETYPDSGETISPKKYFEEMRKSASANKDPQHQPGWGGNLEAWAAAEVYGRPVQTFSRRDKDLGKDKDATGLPVPGREHYTYTPSRIETDIPFRLLHTGDHYNILTIKEEPET